MQRAEAVLARARIQIDRLVPLLRTEAISRQTYDDAVSQRDQAAADVAQARATLARHQLNLQFASVEAPIAGRIDQALVSEGPGVPTDATPWPGSSRSIRSTSMSVNRPLCWTPCASRLARRHRNWRWTSSAATASRSACRGILFSGIEVDAGTGDVLLRVLVDNPERRLLPGLYVQARIPRARYANALSVPQQAVVRTSGQTSVWGGGWPGAGTTGSGQHR